MSISIKTAREIEKMRRAGELLEKVGGFEKKRIFVAKS